MDLVHFEEEEEEKKTCHGFIAFWGVFITNLGKSKSGFEFLMLYNLKMLCESLKQKIVVFMLPLSW